MNPKDISRPPEYWLPDQEPCPGMGPSRYSDEDSPQEEDFQEITECQ